MTTGEEKRKYQAHEAALEMAYRDLRTEFTKALLANPGRMVRTPGFARAVQPAYRAVADLCAADDELHVLDELIRLAGVCANGNDPSTRLPAQALLARMAHAHAEMHKAELAEHTMGASYGA